MMPVCSSFNLTLRRLLHKTNRGQTKRIIIGLLRSQLRMDERDAIIGGFPRSSIDLERKSNSFCCRDSVTPSRKSGPFV